MSKRLLEACQADVRSGRFLRRISAPVVSRVRSGSAQTADSERKYIDVRRLFLFVEESIDKEIHCVVFESNDEPLLAHQ